LATDLCRIFSASVGPYVDPGSEAGGRALVELLHDLVELVLLQRAGDVVAQTAAEEGEAVEDDRDVR